MGRYSGTLANLVEEAIQASKQSHKSSSSRKHNTSTKDSNCKALWNKVLKYLENHSTTDGAIEHPDFESPLPPFSVPSELLDEQLLERKFGPRQDSTILKMAVAAAPASIVAALCHLQPHAARIPDHRGKLPLHVACRRAPTEPETMRIFDILLAVYGEALAHRDTAGRTPLHCLFMYNHAPYRTLELIQVFCQDLPTNLIEALEQPETTNTNSTTTTTGAGNSTDDPASHHEEYPLPQVPNPSVKDKVPSSAAVIPDSRHGALPLHYAVMEGASRDVLRYLLQVYPESRRLVDRRGRTALAWYLGAGYGTNTQQETTTGTNKLLVTGEPADPQTSTWWDKNKIESATVQLLLNSRSARIADSTGRLPLHWAICTLGRYHYHSKQQHFLSNSTTTTSTAARSHPAISMNTIHLLLDHYMEALVMGDMREKTPLHLLFDAVREMQQQEWKRLMRNKVERHNLDLIRGGLVDPNTNSTRETINFSPPLDLLEILIAGGHGNAAGAGASVAGGGESVAASVACTNNQLDDRSPVFMEDVEGRLPIHCAMEVASSPEAIKMLIKAHPTSLVHTTEESLLSPLHAALLSPYIAPLQSPETIRLVLRAYVASRHGTYVDGRLALKMEDADGNYPIHYACRNQACLEVLQLFVEEYPKCALSVTAEGELPLHALLDKNMFEESNDGMPSLGASLAITKTWSSPKEEAFHREKLSVMQKKIELLIDPILVSNNVAKLLQTPSFAHGMTPLHIAVGWGAVPYKTIKRMLTEYPASAEQYTTVEGHKYSPLDLHEYFKSKIMSATNEQKETINKETEEEWRHVRELLFSYSPLLEGHRHLDDILMQSVRVVRSELGYTSESDRSVLERSFHWAVEQELSKEPEVAPLEMTATFNSIEVPDIDHGGRPLSKKAIERSRNPAPTPKNKKSCKSKRPDKNRKSNQEIPKSNSNGSKAAKKSIYDDDNLDTGYVVSDDEHDQPHDFEEDYFSGPESVEEYLSDESDERFDSFDEDNHAVGGEPTATTTAEEGSWDTSKPAERPATENQPNHPGQDVNGKMKEDYLCGIDSADASDILKSPEPCFSEVGMRLLTFFMLFCDKKNPADNYASLVEGILDEVSRVTVEQVVSLPVPAYAAQYLDENERTSGLTLRDVANPKCRALIHKLFYFLGRFDFRSETGGLLLNRSSDNSAVQVRSSEWSFATEEYNEAPELEPGVAEAQVWETGVIPLEEVGYMGTTFKAMRRSVCFLFTKNKQAYHNEVRCRQDLNVAVQGGAFSDSHIVPLIAHYDATGLDCRDDRVYKNDTNNESFITLDIFGGNGSMSSTGESICLTDYPYALVFPYSNYGDLFDYFFRHGVEGMEETREICSQIGKSLSSMHNKGIIHGNVAMRNIVLFPPMEDAEIEEGRKHWALTNLSGASRLQDCNSYMGKVATQGLAEFSSSVLPPEMFVKLDQEGLREYKAYWDAVDKEYGACIDRSLVEPVVDFHTGSSYVIRCHFVPGEGTAEESAVELPPLPYKLFPARESTDIWSFGQLLFMLCSSGRPLFPTNARTGHLLNYKEICDWNMQSAEAMIYEYVEDTLAQDILLRLLSPYEKRASLTMEAVLAHPFFSDIDAATTRIIIDKRRNASIAYRRWLDNNVSEKSEEGWLKERTISVACWDFDFQTRIHLTPTALFPEFLSRSADHLGMPCSFITLPYKLVRNKKGVLTPPSKRDVERAERLGLRMLALSKACHFVNAMKKAVSSSTSSGNWSSTTLLESMNLDKDAFSGLQSIFSQLASQHVEEFRSQPVSVGLKLVDEHIKDFLACYDDASKVLLYLVDEYQGVPVISPTSAPFPCLVQSSARAELALRGLPFMYMCARYARAVADGVPGFVKLIFEAAHPYVPPSWQPVCQGLDNSLNHESIVEDVRVLCDALSLSSNFSLDDNFEYMQKYIADVDPRRMYANLSRVSSGEASVWTGSDGVREIQEAARGFGFKEAIEAKMLTDEKLKAQQKRIDELEAELERLKFHKDLSLAVPDVETSAKASSPSSTSAYKQSEKYTAANADRIVSSKENIKVEASDEPAIDDTTPSQKQASEATSQVKSSEVAEKCNDFNVADQAKALLDNMFADIDTMFNNQPANQGHADKSSPVNENISSTITREEDMNNASPSSSWDSSASSAALMEVTKNELETLKETIRANRAGSAVSADAAKEASLETGIVSRNKDMFSGLKVSDSREPSEVSSTGNLSVQSGSVKKLTSMFLANANKMASNGTESSEIDVNLASSSPDSHKHSSAAVSSTSADV